MDYSKMSTDMLIKNLEIFRNAYKIAMERADRTMQEIKIMEIELSKR